MFFEIVVRLETADKEAKQTLSGRVIKKATNFICEALSISSAMLGDSGAVV